MRISRRGLLKTIGGVTLGAGFAGAGTLLYGTRLETEWIELERVAIPIDQLSSGLEGFKIVLLSDFHLYPNTRLEYIQEVIPIANRLQPDLVALTGDFVLSTADSIFDLAPALAGLNARHGVFSVLGNHDIWKGPEIIRAELERHGLNVLHNRGVTIPHGKDALYLAGLDDAWSGEPDLAAALENYGRDVPIILLAHEPDFADIYSRDSRISLQLSGHSHGGQVRFPGLGSPFLPRYGRKYDLGLYKVRKTWLYTNRGVGVTAPIRINCRPEITEITLVPAERAHLS